MVVSEAAGSSCLSRGKSSCHLSHSPYPSKLLLSLACDAWDKCHWSFQRPLQWNADMVQLGDSVGHLYPFLLHCAPSVTQLGGVALPPIALAEGTKAHRTLDEDGCSRLPNPLSRGLCPSCLGKADPTMCPEPKAGWRGARENPTPEGKSKSQR